MGVRPGDAIYQYLADDGDVTDMSVNASAEFPRVFYFEAERTAYIYRICMELVDENIQVTEWGGEAELTNGLLIQALNVDETVIQHFGTDVNPLKANSNWGNLLGPDAPVLATIGDDALLKRWTLSSGIGQPMELLEGERLQFVVQDDMSGVTLFRAMVQGRYG